MKQNSKYENKPATDKWALLLIFNTFLVYLEKSQF